VADHRRDTFVLATFGLSYIVSNVGCAMGGQVQSIPFLQGAVNSAASPSENCCLLDLAFIVRCRAFLADANDLWKIGPARRIELGTASFGLNIKIIRAFTFALDHHGGRRRSSHDRVIRFSRRAAKI